MFESLSAVLYVCIFHIFNNVLYSIPCLSLATKPLTSSHLLILTSTHNEHIHMISSNILMNIFMQVFGACKSYNYITHLSTYTPTRPRANHRLVLHVDVLLRPSLNASFCEPTIWHQVFLASMLTCRAGGLLVLFVEAQRVELRLNEHNNKVPPQKHLGKKT